MKIIYITKEGKKDSIKIFEISDIYSIDNRINKKAQSASLLTEGWEKIIEISQKNLKKNINDILEEILENECFEIEEIDSKTIGAKSKDPIILLKLILKI